MTLVAPALARFREAFAGEVIGPGDSGYDEARRVWSALHDRRPALVARPTSVEDVVAAVRFARESELVISVRAGGHSISGYSSCDGGIVIDLSTFQGVAVDPDRRLARANGGAYLIELDRAAQEHGLVCPVGTVGHTGIGGLVLGGGVGRLQRRFGLTVDNLTAVELVTADGRVVRASEDENPELFWGVRGAGPNFGVVTAFEFRLHPFGPALTRAVRIYRPADTQALWPAFRDLAASAPREVSGLSFVIGRAVPAEEYPAEVAGGPIAVVALAHLGTEADVAAFLAPLATVAEPVASMGGTTPYLAVQGMYDESMGWGQRYYCDGGFADDLSGTTIRGLLDHVADGVGDSGWSMTVQGGAIADLPEDAMAFTGRSSAYRVMAEIAGWTDPAEDLAVMTWGRRAVEIAADELLTGRYVNEVFEDGTDLATIYGPEKLARLAALKRTWDPDNAFRLNHNIQP